MTAQVKSDLGYILVGSLSATSIGSLIFQGLGALILGFLGALGSYIFVKFIKPKLDNIKSKIKK